MIIITLFSGVFHRACDRAGQACKSSTHPEIQSPCHRPVLRRFADSTWMWILYLVRTDTRITSYILPIFLSHHSHVCLNSHGGNNHMCPKVSPLTTTSLLLRLHQYPLQHHPHPQPSPFKIAFKTASMTAKKSH